MKVKYNRDAVKTIREKYGVTKRYVTQCLTGDRNSVLSDTIRKEYKKITKEIDEVLATNIKVTPVK